jgi:hypothetical protein
MVATTRGGIGDDAGVGVGVGADRNDAHVSNFALLLMHGNGTTAPMAHANAPQHGVDCAINTSARQHTTQTPTTAQVPVRLHTGAPPLMHQRQPGSSTHDAHVLPSHAVGVGTGVGAGVGASGVRVSEYTQVHNTYKMLGKGHTCKMRLVHTLPNCSSWASQQKCTCSSNRRYQILDSTRSRCPYD